MKRDLIMKVRIPEERKNGFLLYAALFGIEIIDRIDGNTVSRGQGDENIIPYSPSRKDSKMED